MEKPRENCIICGNKIFRSKNKRNKRVSIRRKFGLTCSNKHPINCAKARLRVDAYTRNKINHHIKKLKNRIKELEDL